MILDVCVEVYDSLRVSSEQAQYLQQVTKEQSKSKTWFTYRAGRVTASRFKAAASTDAYTLCPSVVHKHTSLLVMLPVKPTICLTPCSFTFDKFDLYRWGCEHEDIARALTKS